MNRWLKLALIPLGVFVVLIVLGTLIPSFIEWRIATPDTWEARSRAGLVALWSGASFLGGLSRFVHSDEFL